MSPARSDSHTSSPADLPAIKERLRAVLPRLREEYAVERLYLHGSRVRGEATAESDLDVLVDFQDSEAGRQISLFDFIALKQDLEELLGMSVDLGERSALRGGAGETIRKEAEPV
jgi:predicted nucleotidyltransferase